MSNSELVLKYIEHINDKELDEMYDLMSLNHSFIDSVGDTVLDRDNMKKAWEIYFRMFPDYKIIVEHMTEKDNIVGVFGKATGTYAVDGLLSPENNWMTLASWRAIVDDGKISLWQVYSDNSNVRKIMQKNGIEID